LTAAQRMQFAINANVLLLFVVRELKLKSGWVYLLHSLRRSTVRRSISQPKGQPHKVKKKKQTETHTTTVVDVAGIGGRQHCAYDTLSLSSVGCALAATVSW